MDMMPRLVRALLLLALLLAVAPSPGVAKELCPQPCHCPQRGWLDCRHAGLATVPLASHRQALTVLDFTGNAIAAVGKKAWKDYPWTETLVLRDNELREVKSHSLEGLFLLKHLDLSCNEILSIEKRAFEPPPFLKLLNLSGNGLMQIRSGAFQAWHGMQFLQDLILSHNPLAVIDDAAFFKLPSVSSLDLSATQVTPQTLLMLLHSTLSLETLQVPKEVACCLCQERPLPESPCRSIQFLCEKLCSSSAPQCAHTGLVQTQGETMDMEQLRSPVLSLRHKESSLGDHETVTLAISLSRSTEGNISRLENSRTNSYPPQRLLGHKGKTSVDDLRIKLKTKLHMAESIRSAKSLLSYQPQPASLKDVLEKTPSSWDEDENESRLNWHGLKPSDVAGGVHHGYHASITAHHRDEEETPGPRKNYIRSHKWHKKMDNPYRVAHNQLLYQIWRPVNVLPKPRAEQGLNRNPDFLSDPLFQSRPAARNRGEATAEEEHSYLGRRSLKIPDTPEEEDSMFLNNAGSPQNLDHVPVPEELLETTADQNQQFLEQDKGLQMFMAHVQRALRTDCSLPQLKLACANMVSQTRLLLKVLSERHETQAASDHTKQCRLQEKMVVRVAMGNSKKLTRKKLAAMVCVIASVVLLSFFILIFLIQRSVFQTCSRPSELGCQAGHTRILCLRRFCVKLSERGRKDNEAQAVKQKGVGSSCQCCPCCDTIHGSSQCRSLFKKSELPWLERIRDVYEAQRLASQEET